MSDAPPQIGFDGKDTVWLRTPVQAYGDTIHKLVLRPPVMKDVRICGFPFKNFTEGERQVSAIDSAVIAAFAARLANVPDSTIDSLGFADSKAVMEAVLSFFGDADSKPASSTAPSTSPGSGVELTPTHSSGRSPLMSSTSLNDRRSA